MPAGPTPIYIVTYNSTQFPGYVQTEGVQLSIRSIRQNILNRNGGIMTPHGAEVRPVSLDFIVLSRLDNVTELQHLQDCKDQFRTAANIVARATDLAPLYVGETTRYYNAMPTSIETSLEAGTSRSLKYRVVFDAVPYLLDSTAVTGSFSGNGTVNLSFTQDTLETYPIFAIPSGVNAFTATHSASGKTMEFVRGTVSGAITARCSNFEVTKDSDGTDASVTMNNVNFGMKHTAGAATMAISVSGYSGSGSVSVSAYPRYPL